MGINTNEPSYTFDVWDQETEVAMYKIGAGNMFFGTPREHALSIGTNNKVALTITADGTTSVNNFKIGRNSIAFAASVPNEAGANGDVVFNTAVKANSPAGWICGGGTKWYQFIMTSE